VTPRMETISPQFMWSRELIASKMRRRVSSARALEIRSTLCLSIVKSEFSEEGAKVPALSEFRVTKCLDSHQNVEVKGSTLIAPMGRR